MTSLSYCIPTRNFGAFIGQTLASLEAECAPEDEVVIVDGNSTDNTPEVVADFSRHFPRVTYLRQQSNGGVDRDLAQAVDRATGDYCWLFSADDALVRGAGARVHALLQRAPDVILMERFDCDVQLRPLKPRRWRTAPAGELSLHELSTDEGLRGYLRSARSLAALFSYVSCIVVRRSAWQQTAPRESMWGTNYAHVSRLFDLLRKPGASLVYLAQPLVLCRGDNDSFLQQGRVRRFLIDVDGYRLIGDQVFETRRDLLPAFNGAFRSDHGLIALVGLRSRIDDPTAWKPIAERLQPFGYPQWMLSLANASRWCRPLVRVASAARRAAIRVLARARADHHRAA